MYKDKKWAPPLAYSLATIVGLSRIYNNAHWASDVLAGAAIGFITAKAMTSLYTLANKKSIAFIPQVGNKSGSLKLIYKF
jgi:membrane-associated phospholipid phosphatase